jgi:heme/copper-type cytochrome/quinol oxidase subunit 1
MASPELKRFLAVAKVTFRVSLVLVGISLVLGVLAAVSMWAPRCAGHNWDERTGGVFALVLVTAFIAAMIGMMAAGGEPLRSQFEVHNISPYEFLPMIRLTLAEVVFYSTLLMALAMIAVVWGLSVLACLTTLAECLGWRLFN